MNHAPLNLKYDSTAAPIIKLTHQIIKHAVILKADAVLMELDTELHLKVEKESEVIREKYRRPTFYEAIFKKRFKDYIRFKKLSYRKLIVSRMFFELNQLSNALKVIHIINGIEQAMPSARGCLFEDITRTLLIAAGVPPKTTGKVSGMIETINPISKWRLESKDLTRRIELRKIQANQTPPT